MTSAKCSEMKKSLLHPVLPGYRHHGSGPKGATRSLRKAQATFGRDGEGKELLVQGLFKFPAHVLAGLKG